MLSWLLLGQLLTDLDYIRCAFVQFIHLDLSQVVASAALFARGATCHLASTVNPPGANMESNQLVASEAIGSKAQSGSSTPATDRGCLNMQRATNLPRFHSGILIQSNMNKTQALFVETLFERPLAEQLRHVGHDVRNETSSWPGRVVSAGWNGYDMTVSLDNRGSWKIRSYWIINFFIYLLMLLNISFFVATHSNPWAMTLSIQYDIIVLLFFWMPYCDRRYLFTICIPLYEACTFYNLYTFLFVWFLLYDKRWFGSRY